MSEAWPIEIIRHILPLAREIDPDAFCKSRANERREKFLLRRRRIAMDKAVERLDPQNDDYQGVGWAYVAEDPDGEQVSVCAAGFPEDAAAWGLEQMDAGNSIRRVNPPPSDRSFEHTDREPS